MRHRLTTVWGILLGVAFAGAATFASGLSWRPERLPSLPDLTEPGMRGDRCNTCHTTGGGTLRNSFGALWERTYPGFEDLDMTASQAFSPVAELDPDGDGFTNAVELALGTHPGNASSKPLRFTRSLVTGLNTLSLPVDPRTPFRARDLLETVGSASDFLIRWNGANGRFVRVDRNTPADAADNVPIDGQSAFLIQMNASRTVSFVGRAWSSSRIRLEPGVNLVALPKRPVAATRLSHLVGETGFGVALSGERFRPYLPSNGPGSPSDGFLEGARGYLIFSTTRRELDFGGVGWTDE
jgi:hypothetical protein